MTENIDQHIFPPGWECKFDRRTGKHYYINYLTKMTSWEDPRIRQKSQQNHPILQQYSVDYIPQPAHASPYLVYPYPPPLPPQHAFQPPPHPTTYSPKAIPKQILQEMGGRSNGSPLSGGSPVLGRTLSLTPKGSPVISRMYCANNITKPQDSPISRVYSYNKTHDSHITLATDTDALVTKISSMFPTVSDTHIKILLKKYYNREAVVISALQVEKHPISTPGPFSTPPAGLSRLAGAAAAALGASSLGGSPRASPPLRPQSGASGTTSSPRSRPHTSPKMKLRYLKSVFPKAEETLILDVLANEDNNVLKSSEKLLGMGYLKRDTAPPRLSLTNKEPEPVEPPPTPPRLKSIEEKQLLKEKLQHKYSTIPERVVSIALESVDWSEERAEQILSVVLQEDAVKKSTENLAEHTMTLETKEDLPSRNKVAALSTPSPVQAPPIAPPIAYSDVLSVWMPSRETNQSERANRRHKTKKEVTKINSSPPSECGRSQSKYLTTPKGSNTALAKGAQDQLLLVDYVTWNGANPELKSGPSIVTAGSTKSLKDGGEAFISQSRGTNKDLRKGSPGLAKGSIYQHIKKSSHLPQMKVGGE